MTKEQECAKYLKGVRYLFGLTGTELANKIGVSHSTISAWENGKTPLSRMAYLAILRVLDEEQYNLALIMLKEESK